MQEESEEIIGSFSEGAAYVDMNMGLIKTSFSKKDFDSITKKLMEVLK